MKRVEAYVREVNSVRKHPYKEYTDQFKLPKMR